MNDQNFSVPAPNAAPPQDTGKGFSIAALVLGIVSASLAWSYVGIIASLPSSIVGVVLAVIGRKRAKAAGASTGMSTAGLVLSIIGLSLSGIVFIAFMAFLPYLGY